MGLDDLAAARTSADVATSLVFTARELSRSRQLAEQLRRALDSRVVIEQAKGVIAHDRRVSVDEAFQRLRNQARRHNLNLHRPAGGRGGGEGPTLTQRGGGRGRR